MIKFDNHYDWLREYLWDFLEAVDVNVDFCGGIISAHGDKCYGYKHQWAEAGIPFEHGVAIYLLTFVAPYGHEVRQRDDGWVNAADWVVDNYDRFKDHLAKPHSV